MIPVFQTLVVSRDRVGNCFNACVASILERPLRQVAHILPIEKGNYHKMWRNWLAEQGYKLNIHLHGDEDEVAPKGYAIATVTTERLYPDGHRKAGEPIYHAVVAFDGIIVHDPYPLGSVITKTCYFTTLDPLSKLEKHLFEVNQESLICKHGYLQDCIVCKIDVGY